MSKEIISSFQLSGTKKGTITITHLEKPYGEKSNDVVSIGISLKGDADNPDWKAHIPYDNVEQVVEGLKKAKMQHGNS